MSKNLLVTFSHKVGGPTTLPLPATPATAHGAPPLRQPAPCTPTLPFWAPRFSAKLIIPQGGAQRAV